MFSWFYSLQHREKGVSKQELVNWHRDVWDSEDVIMWCGRTALLSLVFSGNVYETVKSFMECIPDAELERVLYTLRKEGILTVTKISHRFCLSCAYELTSFILYCLL